MDPLRIVAFLGAFAGLTIALLGGIVIGGARTRSHLAVGLLVVLLGIILEVISVIIPMGMMP